MRLRLLMVTTLFALVLGACSSGPTGNASQQVQQFDKHRDACYEQLGAHPSYAACEGFVTYLTYHDWPNQRTSDLAERLAYQIADVQHANWSGERWDGSRFDVTAQLLDHALGGTP